MADKALEALELKVPVCFDDGLLSKFLILIGPVEYFFCFVCVCGFLAIYNLHTSWDLFIRRSMDLAKPKQRNGPTKEFLDRSALGAPFSSPCSVRQRTCRFALQKKYEVAKRKSASLFPCLAGGASGVAVA